MLLLWFGMNTQANKLCMGLLPGLCQFEHESRSKFKDWAPDAPRSFARTVVNAWKEGSLRRADVKVIKSFIEDELAGWGRD